MSTKLDPMPMGADERRYLIEEKTGYTPTPEVQAWADKVLKIATRQDADDYVVDTLGRMQDELERNLNQVRNGIRALEEERMRRAAPIPPNPAPAPTEIPDEEKDE